MRGRVSWLCCAAAVASLLLPVWLLTRPSGHPLSLNSPIPNAGRVLVVSPFEAPPHAALMLPPRKLERQHLLFDNLGLAPSLLSPSSHVTWLCTRMEHLSHLTAAA